MRFLLLGDLRDRGIHYTRVHLCRLEAAGKFPRKVHLGENSVGWLESEITAWMNQRVAARDNASRSRPRGKQAAKAKPAADGAGDAP